MKTILPLLFLLFSFNSNAQSCYEIISPAINSSGGGSYHVYNDSTINDTNGSIYYICSGAHLTVDYSAGCSYYMENNSQLTINSTTGDVIFAKGNCTIIDNTIQSIVVHKEASSSFSKPNMPSAAIIYTCPVMVFDYSLIGGNSPCGQINGFNEYQQTKLTAYPNPIKNGEHLFFNKKVNNLQLYDLKGELIFESLRIVTNKILFSKLNPGLYIAIVSIEGGKESQIKINIQ